MADGHATVVTGGTGFLGQALLPILEERGHTVRATSRSPPTESGDVEWMTMDLVDDTGIEAAVADQEVLIHCASDALGDTEAVDVDGTRKLLTAAEDAGIEHFVYISIVGIEAIPYAYYEAKLQAETIIEDSPVPSTILRATQFHPFLADIFYRLRWLPVWPLPTKMRLQPIAVEEVAAALADVATRDAQGRLDPMGGPEVHTVSDLARSYRAIRGGWRPIIRVPYPGSVFSAFRAGKATCPDHQVGDVTWEAWLRDTDS